MLKNFCQGLIRFRGWILSVLIVGAAGSGGRCN